MRRALLVLVAATMLGCAREETAPTRLVAVHRFVDHPSAPLAAGLLWGRYVHIDDEDRLTLSSLPTADGTVVDGGPPLPDGPPSEWSLRIPDELQRSAWILVRPRVTGPPGGADLPPRIVSPKDTGPVLLFDLGTHASDPSAKLVAQVTPIPSLAERTIVTDPIAVPAGAGLSLGMGVPEHGWADGATPVQFDVTALDGAVETSLHTTVLDAVRIEDDRRWHDVRIDLAPVAGHTVQFRFTTLPADPAHGGTSLPIWADPVLVAPRTSPALNVVLVSLDTLRARSVSAYGAERRTTPNLDRMMGEEGTVFDAAFTTAPHTLPAHVSVLSGLYLRSHGVTSFQHVLPDRVPMLTEELRAAGYATAAFTEDGFVLPLVGIRRGFSTYRENTSPDLHEPLGQSAKTFRAGLDWLSAHRDDATFLFLHTYEVHHPYTPQPPYDTAFDPVEGAPTDPKVELLRYEQEARYLDDELRAFLDGVDALGLGARTLVVVFADHGEEFREHGLLRHGLQIYDESVHVPLMMRLPGVVPAGWREKTPASLVDVAPTILDVVGAPPLVGADGTSLAPLFRGETLPEWRRAVFSESVTSLLGGIDLLGVRIADAHCIFFTRKGTSECYDPVVDPQERKPILGDDRRPEIARGEAITFAGLRPAVPLATTPTTQGAEAGDLAGRIEKLRALGYIQ